MARCRYLAPEVIQDVLPHLPPPADPKGSFDRDAVSTGMDRMAKEKEISMTKYWPHLRKFVTTEDVSVPMRDGELRTVRIYIPKNESGKAGHRLVLYSLHGGGFVAGSIDSEDLINRQLCSTCDILVFCIDYRLAPKYPVIPTVFNDCEDGLKWTYDNASKYGGDVSKAIFVSGTSAGATAAGSLALRSAELNIPIGGVIMRQPPLILADYKQAAKSEWLPRIKSHEENYDAPILNGTVVDQFNRMIGIPLEQVQNGKFFPIFASKEELSHMPPTYLIEATCDPYADELELYAELLEEAGAKIKVKRYDGMPHGFHAHHILPQARAEMIDTAEAVKWLIETAQA